MQLENSKTLLTGATGGIGLALARHLSAMGAELVLAGRQPARLQQLANQLNADGGHCSVAQLDMASDTLSEQIAAIQREHPDINIVLNCAGINTFGAIEALSERDIDSLLTTNLRGAIVLNQAFVPLLKARPEAAIVNVGSTFGSIGHPGFSLYCASKFGLRGFTEALQRELSDTRVHVIYVAPRATRTTMNDDTVNRMNDELRVTMDDPEKVAAQIIGAIRRNRLRLYIGWPEKLFVKLNGLLTSLIDNAFMKQLPIIQRYMKLHEV